MACDNAVSGTGMLARPTLSQVFLKLVVNLTRFHLFRGTQTVPKRFLINVGMQIQLVATALGHHVSVPTFSAAVDLAIAVEELQIFLAAFSVRRFQIELLKPNREHNDLRTRSPVENMLAVRIRWHLQLLVFESSGVREGNTHTHTLASVDAGCCSGQRQTSCVSLTFLRLGGLTTSRLRARLVPSPAGASIARTCVLCINSCGLKEIWFKQNTAVSEFASEELASSKPFCNGKHVYEREITARKHFCLGKPHHKSNALVLHHIVVRFEMCVEEKVQSVSVAGERLDV